MSNKAVMGKYFVMTSINRNHVRGSGQGDTPRWVCVCDVTIFKWYDQRKTTSNLIAMKFKWIIYIYIYNICKYDIVMKPYNMWNSFSPHTTQSFVQNYSHDHCSFRIHTKDFVIEIITLRQFNSSYPGQNGRHFAEDIFKRIFLNEKVHFWPKYHWSLFLSVPALV